MRYDVNNIETALNCTDSDELSKMSGLPHPTHRKRAVFGNDTLLRPEDREADAAYIRCWHRRAIARQLQEVSSCN